MVLSAQQILDADDRPIVEVHVPEWATGGDDVVCLRALDGPELYRFRVWISLETAGGSKGMPDEIMVRMVAAYACDVQGVRIFTDKQIAKLARKNGIPLRRLFDASWKLVPLDDEARENFPEASAPTSGSGSGSDSPSTAATGTPK